MNETVEETEVVNTTETNAVGEAAANAIPTAATTTPAITAEEMAKEIAEETEELLKEYTNNKSIIEVPVGSEGGKANVEVVHTVTLGDMYIMILLTLILITTLLSRLIGRR